MKVFEDFRYVEQLEGGDAAALIFKARVGDRERRRPRPAALRRPRERSAELTVMVRPMSGLNALAEAMGREFERLGIAPPAGAAARSAGE